MGGCFCCCERKTTDLPEKYEENRSCTDIIFLVLFIGAWAAFVVLGVVAFKSGDVRIVWHGTDYLGYHCGDGDGPANFSSSVPPTAPYQSQNWRENRKVWYPLPLMDQVTDFLHVKSYLNLGVCVKKCPKTNLEGLTDLLTGKINQTALAKMQVYSYGSQSVTGQLVSAASTMYALYDTSSILSRCLPTFKQPMEVRKKLSSPLVEKAYLFVVQGVQEVMNSWRVFLIEAGISIVLCFTFLLLLRYCIHIVVWFVVCCVFFLLAGGGAVAFVYYKTKGHTPYFAVAGMEEYSVLFLVLAIVLWVASCCYFFIIVALSGKIRFVCSVIRVAGRVVGSAPSLMLLPFAINLVIIALFVWSAFIAIGLYTAKVSGKRYSLVPVTSALQYDNSIMVDVNNTKFFVVASQIFNSRYAYEYLMIADLFGFLWSAGFVNAVCFTTISFVSVFWYYSSLRDGDKRVPFFGVLKGVFWTLFYHSGTLALGSLLIAIIQTLRFLLAYFAKKARISLQDNFLVKCMVCYLQCFLAFFERVLSVINTNAYVMMCLTSQNFCLSACNAISLILNYAVELLFLGWFVSVIVFFGELFVVFGCCLSTYFLCRVDKLASDVEVFVLPILVVGFVSYILSRSFFSVYESAASALLVCYCYDRKVNASRGFYYVPLELEYHIGDYSQRRKLRQFNSQQAGVHRRDSD